MSRRLAVVTGAASGIGLALSSELLRRDFEVLAIDRDPIPLDPAPGLRCARLDVRDAGGMQALADEFRDRPLDCLFANAGIAAPGAVLSASPADWQQAWAVNTFGPLDALRRWWPHLRAARGKAVVTASAAALIAHPGAALYRASKAALLSLLESLYYETRDDGVALHVLCPGLVRSNILAHAARDGTPLPPDPFTRFLEQAMPHAEPAEDFARRVLDGLAGGEAPFYWLTHDETRAPVAQRLHDLLDAGRPCTDFGGLTQ